MKKLYLLSIGIAVLFLLLTIYNASLPICSGTITEVGSTYYTHGAGDDLRRYYNEIVTVDTGEEIIENVRVTRLQREELPQAGDSIQVFGHKEYRSAYQKTGKWILMGILYTGVSLLFAWIWYSSISPDKKEYRNLQKS